MANLNLFRSFRGPKPTATDTVNSHGAPAYALSPEAALAQYAVTGCLNQTFYATAATQLERVLELCDGVPLEFVAQVAIYARESGYMKDMPALLCAWLSSRSPLLHERIFARVIDNARMLRTYVQILRSGVTGRKSLGTAPKRLVLTWLARRDEETLFRSSVGQDPSFADVLRMVHPRPADSRREAFYGYMLGRPYDPSALPSLIAEFEQFKSGETLDTPDLPFMMLAEWMSRRDWVSVARNASWQTLRMNLNTLARHGVFDEPGLAEFVAERLVDTAELERARVLPYQLMAAFLNADAGVPQIVRDALELALEATLHRVPSIDGQIYVCLDVSGSMQWPVTGYRPGASTTMRCVDVAALIAAALVRRNPRTEVVPFETKVVRLEWDLRRDTVLENAARLASVGGGGTNCSAALAWLNDRRAQGDLVLFVSDNESWADPRGAVGTALLREWQRFRVRNPNARLVCLDLQPNQTTQAPEREDILNVGGFSDTVFDVVAQFASGEWTGGHWVRLIRQVHL